MKSLNHKLSSKKSGPARFRRAIFFIYAAVFFVSGLSGAALCAQSLSLDDTLKNLGSPALGPAELRWDPFFGSGVFSSGDHRASFAAGNAGETGPVLFDNREVATVPLPYTEQGSLRFPEAFVHAVRNSFVRYAEEDKSKFKIAAIIVDPGHGGKDPGAIGTHTINGQTLELAEKDVVLNVSRLLHSRLAAAYPDKRILMTREGDTFPSLEDRVVQANSVPLKDNEAIIYISVHANYSFNKTARGYEVWYLSPGYRRELIDKTKYEDSREIIPLLNDMLEEEITTESILMARYILQRFDEVLGKNMISRGLKQEEWYVVRNARMPSVLVELGFVSNENDARLMRDDTYLKNFSEALYKGISDFIAIFER